MIKSFLINNILKKKYQRYRHMIWKYKIYVICLYIILLYGGTDWDPCWWFHGISVLQVNAFILLYPTGHVLLLASVPGKGLRLDQHAFYCWPCSQRASQKRYKKRPIFPLIPNTIFIVRLPKLFVISAQTISQRLSVFFFFTFPSTSCNLWSIGPLQDLVTWPTHHFI